MSRGDPQPMTLNPGGRYQFRGVFTIESRHDTPVDIEWCRVVDDPYEQQLAAREDQAAELDRLRAEVKWLRGGDDPAPMTYGLDDTRALLVAPMQITQHLHEQARVERAGRPVFGQPLTLTVEETPVRARDVRPGAQVRPAFASEPWTALQVRPLHGPYVRILWAMDGRAPEPFTVFEGAEWLAER